MNWYLDWRPASIEMFPSERLSPTNIWQRLK